MGTMVRMTPAARRPERPLPVRRYRRRWRFRPRGLIGIALTIVILINLYVLVDNVVCLIRKHRDEANLMRGLDQQDRETAALRERRDYMESTEYLRDSAHRLGYAADGEPTAEEVPVEVDSPVKRRLDHPSIPY